MTKEFIDNILIDPSVKEEGLKLYNYSEKSESADFYYNQFFKNEVTQKEAQPIFDKVPLEMKEAMAFFKDNLNSDAVVVELGGSKYQHRSGYPNYVYKNYIPLDISYASIKGYVDTYDRYGFVFES